MSWRKREKLRSLIVGGKRSSALKRNLKQSNSLLFDYAKNLFSSILDLLIYVHNSAVLNQPCTASEVAILDVLHLFLLLYSLNYIHGEVFEHKKVKILHLIVRKPCKTLKVELFHFRSPKQNHSTFSVSHSFPINVLFGCVKFFSFRKGTYCR